MIQLQIVLDIRGNDQNTIALHILEREDANGEEREVARSIEALYLATLEELKRQMPGEVEIERIGSPTLAEEG